MSTWSFVLTVSAPALDARFVLSSAITRPQAQRLGGCLRSLGLLPIMHSIQHSFNHNKLCFGPPSLIVYHFVPIGSLAQQLNAGEGGLQGVYAL